MRDRSAWRLDVQLLGEFRVAVDGRPIAGGAWEPRRTGELVKLLALAEHHRLAREQVIEALWSHLAPDAGAAALHKTASQVRSILGRAEAIVVRGGQVALAPEAALVIDADGFEQAAREALARGDAHECAQVVGRYTGELLPGDRYAEWCGAARERLQSLHLSLLRQAGAWEQVLEVEPTDENAHVALMRRHAESGNRAAALKQFRSLREVLARELGVGPNPLAVELYEAIARGPAIHAPVTGAVPMVGRLVELESARAVWRKVAAGHGGALFIRGDAGIGKTRFCEAVLVEAARNGATTLRGAARPEEGSTRFGPVVEALDRLLLARPELVLQLTETAREVLARLATAAPGGSPGPDAPLGRQRILHAIAQLLTVAAKERPVLLFIDDVHGADDSTVQLLAYVARLARFDRLLLLVAFRSQPGPVWGQVRTALLGRGGATEIELQPLTAPECAALVARLTEGRASPAMARDISDRSEGSPFYVEVLAAASGPAGAMKVPEYLYQVIAQRLDRLDRGLVRVLEGGAVLGEAFDTEALIALIGRPEQVVFQWLEAAVREGVLVSAPGGFRFHHTLLHEAIVRGLPLPRAQALHREAAAALARVGGSAARVARHLLQGGRADEAGPWLHQAARDEASVGAHASALQLVELALTQVRPHVDLLALRAELLFRLGHPDAAAAFEGAIRRARGRRRHALRVQQAEACIAVGDADAALEAITDLHPPADERERFHYLFVRSELDWLRGELDGAEQAAAEARVLAHRLGDAAELADAVMLGSLVAHSRGTWSDHVRADLLALGGAEDLATAVHEGHLCVAEAYLYGARSYAEVARFARELRATGEHTGARRAVAFATCLLGETELLIGELDRARAHLHVAARLSLEVGSRGGAALALQRQAEAAMLAGDPLQARVLLSDALDLARCTPLGQKHLLQRVYGTRLRLTVDPPEGLAVLAEAEVAIVGPYEGCEACLIALAVPAASACARAGDLDRGHRYLAAAEQSGELFWRAAAWRAAIAEAGADLAFAEGDRARAVEHLQLAVEGFRKAGHRLDTARCRKALKAAS